MDRSYLSDQAVVEASRQFICVRLATYEDQGEADFLTSLYSFRGNVLKNSVFALLDRQTRVGAHGESARVALRELRPLGDRREMQGDVCGHAGDAFVSRVVERLPVVGRRVVVVVQSG